MSNALESPATAPDYDYSLLYKSPAGIEFYKNWYETKLAGLKIPYERRTVQTRFGYSHALVAGPEAAPPLILIGGLLDTSIEWIQHLHLFARAGTYRRIYALDVPGWSPVSAPVSLSYANQEGGLWLVEMMYGLGIKRADFVAFGNGAGFIFKLAALMPGRISSAILMHPSGIVAQRPPNLLKYLEVLAAVYFPRPGLIRRMIKHNLAPSIRNDRRSNPAQYRPVSDDQEIP